MNTEPTTAIPDASALPDANGPVLGATRAAEPLTAAEAVAWFAATTPPGRRVIGYALSPRAAVWVVVQPEGTIDVVAPGGDPLAEAYELVFFDGARELRWLRDPDGRGAAGQGAAVALGEDPATLPPGENVTADPPHGRGEKRFRLLAGVATAHARPEWTTLRGGRYAVAHLPCRLGEGDTLMVESVEYLVEDEHGNLDVADTRIVAITPRSLAERTKR